MFSQDFDSIEQAFGELLAGNLPFSKSDSDEVKRFIDVGEYGIALETLIAIIIDEDKFISPSAFDVLSELARRMELEEELVSAGLDKRIASGGAGGK